MLYSNLTTFGLKLKTMKKLIYLFLGLLIVAFTTDNNNFYETN